MQELGGVLHDCRFPALLVRNGFHLRPFAVSFGLLR